MIHARWWLLGGCILELETQYFAGNRNWLDVFLIFKGDRSLQNSLESFMVNSQTCNTSASRLQVAMKSGSFIQENLICNMHPFGASCLLNLKRLCVDKSQESR
jgi:hypothetical protein